MYQKRNNNLAILALYTGNYKKSFYLREIAKLSKIPLKTTQTALSNLEKLKILKSKVHGKNKYFQLNLENIETKLYLLKSEIYKTLLFLLKYPLLKPFLREIKETPIIIFGSFAKFNADKNSDLDILLISEKKVELPFHLLPYKIHKIQLSEKEFIRGINVEETFIKEVKQNYIILNNYSYFVNVMWNEYAR